MKRIAIILLLCAACSEYEPVPLIEPNAVCTVNCNNGLIRPKIQIDGDYQIAYGKISFWISTTAKGVLCLDTIITMDLSNEVVARVKISGYKCGESHRVDFDGRGWLIDGTEVSIKDVVKYNN